MKGFIEITHTNGEKSLINVASIVSVDSKSGGVSIVVTKTDSTFSASCRENYETIKALIEQAN